MILSRNKQLTHFLIAILLVITCIYFFSSSNYLVGGDDSRLYYMYPDEMIHNYTGNLYDNNIAGSLGFYGTQSFQIPFYLIISFFKHTLPFVNTQSLLYGLNISFGYYGFVLLLRELTRKRQKITFEILSGLFYVFSNFTLYTLWRHQLFSLYLISFFPWALILFIRSITSKDIKYIVYLSVLCSLFSVVIMSPPWLIGAIICLFPLLLYFFWSSKMVFIRNSLILICLVLLMNMYWIFHFVYANISGNKAGGDLISSAFNHSRTVDAASTMIDSSAGNRLLEPFLYNFHSSVQPTTWELVLYVIFPLAIGCYILSKKKKPAIYYIVFLCWFISIYFFTVKVFGEGGLSLFLFLNSKIPGFNMFRFMFDKFSYGIALTSSLLIGMSFELFETIKNKKYINLIYIFLSGLAIIMGAKMFLYIRNPLISGTSTSYSSINSLNSDFIELTKYINNFEDGSRFIWLPINVANYAVISDQNLADHYYFGISPLLFLSGRGDIAGTLGLGRYSSTAENFIRSQNGKEYQDFLNELNINYIIVNNEIDKEISGNFIYPNGLYKLQMNRDFSDQVLGDKVKDFGQKYSLYKVKQDKDSFLLSSYDNKTGISEKIDTTSSNPNKIHLSVNVDDPKTIVFKVAENANWETLTDKGQDLSLKKLTSEKFGNMWFVNKEICLHTKCIEKNGRTFAQIYLFFKPAVYDIYVKLVSIVTISAAILYIILSDIINKTVPKKYEI